MSKRFLALLLDYAFFYPILGYGFLLALSRLYQAAPPFIRILTGSGLCFAAFFFRDLFTPAGSPGNWLVGLKAPRSAASSILRALPAQLFPALLIYALSLAERIFEQEFNLWAISFGLLLISPWACELFLPLGENKDTWLGRNARGLCILGVLISQFLLLGPVFPLHPMPGDGKVIRKITAEEIDAQEKACAGGSRTDCKALGHTYEDRSKWEDYHAWGGGAESRKLAKAAFERGCALRSGWSCMYLSWDYGHENPTLARDYLLKAHQALRYECALGDQSSCNTGEIQLKDELPDLPMP